MDWFCDQRADQRSVGEAILEVTEKRWNAYGEPEPGMDWECARMSCQTSKPTEGQQTTALHRHPAAQRQGGLFADGSSCNIVRCSATSGIGNR